MNVYAVEVNGKRHEVYPSVTVKPGDRLRVTISPNGKVVEVAVVPTPCGDER